MLSYIFTSHMNKPLYTTPSMERIALHVEGLIATSIAIDQNTVIDNENDILSNQKGQGTSIWE